VRERQEEVEDALLGVCFGYHIEGGVREVFKED
jgi:hypothetical protein